MKREWAESSTTLLIESTRECDDVHQIYKVMQDFTEIATPGAYLAESFSTG